MTDGDFEGRIFLSYPHTHHRFFFLPPLFLFSYLSKNRLPEVSEYAQMQFHMITLLFVLGKIAWVRSDFLSQGKILDIHICVQEVFLCGIHTLKKFK